MNDILVETSDIIGHIYFLFVLVLAVTNSLATYVIDENNEFETRFIVGGFSLVNVIIFSFLGAEMSQLILFTFATFGAFSFFGKHVEKAYMWVFLRIYDFSVKAIKWIKNKFNFTK
jgi:hypothetical protein